MIIGDTKQPTQRTEAITAQRQRIGGNDRRGASPGRGGEDGGGVRATATPFDPANGHATHSAHAMTGFGSAAVDALLFALIAQRMNNRLAAQAVLA